MEVHATDTFFKSLKRLSWQSSKTYRAYSAIRYELPYFFKNIWKFRKELWAHRWWDYTFTLMILKRSLEIQEEGMRTKGIEVNETLDKKLEKMQMVIQYLKNKLEDNFIETAEKKHGPIKLDSWRFEKTDSGNYIMVDDQTEEEKARRAEANRGKVKPKQLCPHCNQMIAVNTYPRWHGDNCKHKP